MNLFLIKFQIEDGFFGKTIEISGRLPKFSEEFFGRKPVNLLVFCILHLGSSMKIVSIGTTGLKNTSIITNNC